MRLNGLSSLERICGAILLPLMCLSSLTLAQWPRFHGNSLNTGVVPGAQGRSGTFSELWVYPLKYNTDSSPALADLDDDGLLEVVIGSNTDTLYAFNGEDGSILWSSCNGMYTSSSPIINDIDGDQKPEVVFATDSSLIVLQGESGELVWSRPVDGGFGISPCTADLDGDGRPEVIWTGLTRTSAFDGETGAVLWSAEGYSAVWYGSAVAEDTDLDGSAEVMAFTLDPSPAFCLLDGTDGSLIWSTPISVQGSITTPAAAFADLDMNGYPEIVSCSGDNDLYVMNADDGSILWSLEFPGNYIYSSPCLIDLDGNDSLEIVVALYNTKELRAYTCTGDIVWSSSVDFWPLCTAAIEDIDGDQTLEIIQTSSYPSGSLQVFDAETGAEEWKLSFSEFIFTSPAIGDLDGDGYYDFVFACDNGYIYAMSTEPQGIDPESSNDPLNSMVCPNPFRSSVSISFELSEPGYTSIEVIDLSGRLVCSLAESELESGQHSFTWDGRNKSGELVSSGMYICRIQSGRMTESVSLCLLR